MSIIHQTTMTPTKLELLAGWLPTRPWYTPTGREPELVKAGGFRLDDPDGEVGIEFMVAANRPGPAVYLVPMTYRGAPLASAADALIGTSEHGVLGQRWIYDGVYDPVLVGQLAALIQGHAVPQAQSKNDTADPTVHAQPATAGQLVVEDFTVSDGTELRVTDTRGGVLTIAVHRVLLPVAGAARPGVTATWNLDDGTSVRGEFVTAAYRGQRLPAPGRI